MRITSKLWCWFQDWSWDLRSPLLPVYSREAQWQEGTGILPHQQGQRIVYTAWNLNSIPGTRKSLLLDPAQWLHPTEKKLFIPVFVSLKKKKYCLLSPHFTAEKWGEMGEKNVVFFSHNHDLLNNDPWEQLHVLVGSDSRSWLITMVLKRHFPLLKSDSFKQCNETPHSSNEVTEYTWNSPVIDELDRIEKEHTCWDGFPDGLGSSVLCVTEQTTNQNTFYYKLRVKWSSRAKKLVIPSGVRSRVFIWRDTDTNRVSSISYNKKISMWTTLRQTWIRTLLLSGYSCNHL